MCLHDFPSNQHHLPGFIHVAPFTCQLWFGFRWFEMVHRYQGRINGDWVQKMHKHIRIRWSCSMIHLTSNQSWYDVKTIYINFTLQMMDKSLGETRWPNKLQVGEASNNNSARGASQVEPMGINHCNGHSQWRYWIKHNKTHHCFRGFNVLNTFFDPHLRCFGSELTKLLATLWARFYWWRIALQEWARQWTLQTWPWRIPSTCWSPSTKPTPSAKKTYLAGKSPKWRVSWENQPQMDLPFF